ncbi:alpha/beta hydrolase family protein [Streptomyces sp. NPDC056411]|uniref:alpha/beta hydrolase family protein n=1 Tax=Streptomyces sp. NPDC056411 TaxID=3345813 RepID=UPI0035D8C140
MNSPHRTHPRTGRLRTRGARRAAVALLLAAALPLPVVAAGTAVATPAPSAAVAAPAPHRATTAPHLELPRPTGPFAVGRDTLHLTDTRRRDPWMPSAGARELMVSVSYPAHRGTGGATAPYMSTKEARLFLEGIKHADALPPEVLAATRTHARTGARPVDGAHPLVVLSPGFTLNRATLSLLTEELASRGYVVALVDHAYESFGTSFPGGRTLTCAACKAVEKGSESAARKMIAKVATGRAADIRFVIDTLTGAGGRDGDHSAARRYASLIDARRIGAAGHSIGGNSAAAAMATDRRVRAGINMDGSFFAPVPRTGLGGRPFMMLGSLDGHAPGSDDTTWPRDWRRLDGWKRWLTVRDAGHFSFIDVPVLAAQLGVSDPSAPLSGKRSGEITRDYVGAFFDQHLRGIPQPLLAGPSPANPEVTFQRP